MTSDAQALLDYPARPPANTRHRPNVGPMLGQRRRRWPNIGSTLGRCLVFAGPVPYIYHYHLILINYSSIHPREYFNSS